ncbi:hypothetical protein KCP74_14285 [Salmonella enterica subsp. enterica]|nr:hypothetical protein KCP74_14285 [Salmonella enterica subsp. enterica]
MVISTVMRGKAYCRSRRWGKRPECLMALCLSGLCSVCCRLDKRRHVAIR